MAMCLPAKSATRTINRPPCRPPWALPFVVIGPGRLNLKYSDACTCSPLRDKYTGGAWLELVGRRKGGSRKRNRRKDLWLLDNCSIDVMRAGVELESTEARGEVGRRRKDG
jgi:hypothetical protein